MNRRSGSVWPRRVPLLAVTVALSGCAVGEHIRDIAQAAQLAGERIEAAQQGFTAQSEAERQRLAQDVARPWLVGKARPLAREVTLPPALRADVDTTLLFDDGPVSLSV